MGGYIPPWPPWFARTRGEVANPEMRVSDGERSEVAESLSKNYSEGRLDEAEFNERLQRAMSAKTRGDLAGLMVDLPAAVVPPPPGVARRRRTGRFVFLVLAVFLFSVAVSSMMLPWHFPWLLFAVLFFCIWRASHRRLGWYGHHYVGGPPPPPAAGPGGAGPAGSAGSMPEPYYGRRRGGRWL